MVTCDLETIVVSSLPKDSNDSNTVGFSHDIAKSKYPSLENIPRTKLFEQLKLPAIGKKDGSYFVRTRFKDTKAGRNDKNLADTSKVLILDADSSINPETGEITEGAPDPLLIHNLLKQQRTNHFIYRSYSHGQKGNRYRIIFITDRPYSRVELEPTVNHALKKCGSLIAPVKENLRWSQPWYLPRKPVITKDDFTYLEYSEDNQHG